MFAVLKDHNRSLILRQFSLHAPLSLNCLVELTQLSRSSVTNYVKELKADGLVAVDGRARRSIRASSGRRQGFRLGGSLAELGQAASGGSLEQALSNVEGRVEIPMR